MLMMKDRWLIRHDPFKQDLVPVLDLPRVTNADGTRFYTTPEGKAYPSITTVLNDPAIAAPWLAEWRMRVGAEEARKVSGRATRRGTIIHKLFEDYLKTGFIDLNRQMPDVRQMVRDTAPLLNHINRVVAQEIPLYSDTLRLAGTTDLIADWDGILSVVDYKNSNYKKSREDILGYFAQCSGYATMFEERYKVPVKQVVIVVAVENLPGQMFVEKAEDHRAYLQDAIDSYWSTHGAKEAA